MKPRFSACVLGPLLLVAISVPPLISPTSGPASVTVLGSLDTVRLDQPTPTDGASSEANLSAAGNEFESFQVVVQAGSAPVDELRVSRSAVLSGPGGATIPARNVTIYREVAYQVGTASDAEGGAGLWPDALIPEEDYFYGENRRAFPIDVPSGQRVVAWVDVLVPRNQPAGTYRGSIDVTDASGVVAQVPVQLNVRGFSIPSTSSLASSFGFEWGPVCDAHGQASCSSAGQRWQLDSLYAKAGLENRVTLSNPFPVNYEDAPPSARLFRRYLAPLIRGRSSVRLPGARLTSIAAYWQCIDSARCLPRWRKLVRRFNLEKRFFLFLCDEPSDDVSLWRECESRATRAKRRWPGVRKLVTATIREAKTYGGGRAALRRIDTLVPIVNNVIGTRQTYKRFLRKRLGGVRNRLWLYTSCRSYGCGGSPSDSTNHLGWPGYAIDEPATQARAMGWLAFEYGAAGELYYQTTSLLDTAWKNQYRSGGNGDGTLFYAGSPSGVGGAPAIGGQHDIPIESIRLKRIRDGREDYEYLKKAAARGRRSAAVGVLERLFGSPDVAMDSATVAPGALEAARGELATLIVAGRRHDR